MHAFKLLYVRLVKSTPFSANVTDHGILVDRTVKTLMINLSIERLFLPNVTDRHLRLLLGVIKTEEITK